MYRDANNVTGLLALPARFSSHISNHRQALDQDVARKMDELRSSMGGIMDKLRNPSAAPVPSRARHTPCKATVPGRLYCLQGNKFASVIPGDSVVEAVVTSGISSFLSLYNAALIGRLILTWFPSPPQAIVYPLATLCDPYLNLFRGIIPPLGGTIDLSPILAFIVLDLFSNTAAALPCETSPCVGDSPAMARARRDARWRAFNPSGAVMAWRRRMAGARTRRQEASQQ